MLVNPIVLTLALAAQLPEPPPAAIVAGRVVDAGTGRPIAGVVVTPAGSAAVASPGGSGPPRVLTNAGGNFVLRGLSKGSLVLTATKGGYVNATHGQRRPGGSTQPIPVDADQRITDVEIRMWKYGAIAGTIVDEAGDPVVGLRVQALRKTFVASRRRFTPGPVAGTDDRGMYRLSGLTPGDYIVMAPSTQTAVPTDVMESFFSGTPISDARRVELGRELGTIGSAIAPAGSQHAMKAGSQTLSLPAGTLSPIATGTGILVYPTVYYPSAATANQAGTVSVRSGDDRSGIDLQIRPVRGVSVSGMLMGPEGSVATTGVRLVQAADEALEPIDVATALTDPTGAFTFPAVPAGSYVLRVVRVPRPPVQDVTFVAQMPLSVGDRDLTDLVVPLAAGPRVSGRITFEGTIERPSGPAITGMRIRLDPADGPPTGEGMLAMETGGADESGDFRTYGVPPGRYVVRVSVLPAGWVLKSALYQNRDIADMPIELLSKDVSGVVLTFTDRPSSVGGTVRGADGPDPAAAILVYPVDSAAWSSSGALSRRMRTARAAKDGSYSIQALPAGDYFVVAVREDQVGEWQDPALLQALSRYAQTVRLADGEQKTQNLVSATVR